MYILYLDESGDPSASNDQDYFVLGGIAVHEGQIHNLSTQIDKLQASVFPNLHTPVEFHAQHIVEGKGRFRSLQKEERAAILSTMSAAIGTVRWPGVVAFATAVHVSAVSAYVELRPLAFEDVCQRFNTFLVRGHKRGNPQKGLLVVDRSHSERQYLELITTFRHKGTKYGYLGNIIDIPYFTESHNTRLMQLADLYAYAVYRYYERADRTYFDRILPHFDRRGRSSPPDGLKHIPGTATPCTCEACQWR